MTRRAPWLLVLLTACASEQADPDDLIDPTVGLFADLQDADADRWADAVTSQIVSLDPASPRDARTFVVQPLDPDRVEVTDGSEVVVTALGRAVAGYSEHDPDDHRRLSGLAGRACVETPWATSWQRTFDVDGCWALGTCRDATATSELVLSPGQGDLPLSVREEFVRVEVDVEDGDDFDVLVMRSWAASAEPSDVPGETLSAWFSLKVWVEDPEDASASWILDVVWTDLALPDETVDALGARLEETLDSGRRRADSFLDAALMACDEGA